MAVNGQRLHYEGVLEKAGKRFFEGFRRRWFILDGKNLSYYKAPETMAENLLGIIDLTKVKAVVPFKMMNNNAFQIITSMRTYTFTAATPQLMTEWISVLRQAMQLESFNNRRGKASVRDSSEDDSGYEVVSSPRSTSSDQVINDESLYDQVTSEGCNNVPTGTYESVGREEESESNYDTVNLSPVRSDPQNNELGSYGVIGEPRVETPNVADLYAKVDKKRSLPGEVTKKNEEAMYADVATAETKAPRTEVSPMSIICESDDDEEEEEQTDNDDGFDDEELARLQTDPLPPPKGNCYAVDQIKLLLKDFKKDDIVKMNQELAFEDITENDPVSESSEKAFVRLRDFLDQLEER